MMFRDGEPSGMRPSTMLAIHLARRPQPRPKRLRSLFALVVVTVLAYVCWAL
jgi:hypothetical protein